MNLITLTSDFGTCDWFVGTMKGVIFSINPRVTVVDLTHEIPPGDIRAGAFALAAGCRFFPHGTVHVVVVDPGVGGPREGIAVQTEDYIFIGPDNGVLSLALARERIKMIRQLKNEALFLSTVSHTFHGRDVFAPAAAHLSSGVPPRKCGPRQEELVQLEWPRPRVTAASVKGEIVYIDRFGNLITNIGGECLEPFRNTATRVFGKGRKLCSVADFYQAVPAGKPVAVLGSTGFLEIAVNGGSAARMLQLEVGDPVQVRAQS